MERIHKIFVFAFFFVLVLAISLISYFLTKPDGHVKHTKSESQNNTHKTPHTNQTSNASTSQTTSPVNQNINTSTSQTTSPVNQTSNASTSQTTPPEIQTSNASTTQTTPPVNQNTIIPTTQTVITFYSSVGYKGNQQVLNLSSKGQFYVPSGSVGGNDCCTNDKYKKYPLNGSLGTNCLSGQTIPFVPNSIQITSPYDVSLKVVGYNGSTDANYCGVPVLTADDAFYNIPLTSNQNTDIFLSKSLTDTNSRSAAQTASNISLLNNAGIGGLNPNTNAVNTGGFFITVS